MRHAAFRIGFVLVLLGVLAAAQASAPATQAPPAIVVADTDATRAAARDALEDLRTAKELGSSGDSTEVRAAVRETLANLLAVPGREASAAIADALEDFGKAAGELNDTECAVQALEPALAFRLATLGPDDERVQALRATIGRSCWELGRLETSRELLGQVLDHARRTLEPGDRRMCGPMSDYAVTLYYLDDCESARLLMTDVVEILTKNHDADDPQIQWAFGNLGNMLDKLGDIDGAVAIRERVHRNFVKSRQVASRGPFRRARRAAQPRAVAFPGG